MDKIDIKAPAKINLYLDVLSKQENGYHNIKSVMQTVSICDEITGTKLEHQWKDATCETAVTCTLCGKSRIFSPVGFPITLMGRENDFSVNCSA